MLEEKLLLNSWQQELGGSELWENARARPPDAKSGQIFKYIMSLNNLDIIAVSIKLAET